MKFFLFLTIAAMAAIGTTSGGQVAPKSIMSEMMRVFFDGRRSDLKGMEFPRIDFGEQGNMTNVKMGNLENYVLKKCSANGLLSSKIQLEFYADTVSVRSDFYANHVTDNDMPNLDLVGVNGCALAMLNDITLTVTVDVWINPSFKLVATDFSDFDIKVGGFWINMSSIENEEENNAIMNEHFANWCNTHISKYVNEHPTEMLDFMNEILEGETHLEAVPVSQGKEETL